MRWDVLYNIYPIYDWHASDIWTYHGKYPDPPHNFYDRMHQGSTLTLHSNAHLPSIWRRPQRKGWDYGFFQIIEPETWAKVVARVNGANPRGALYAQNTGNILGVGTITKPEGHTWESFAMLLLETMPGTDKRTL